MDLQGLVYLLIRKICLIFVVARKIESEDAEIEFERLYDLIVILQNCYPNELGSRIKMFNCYKRKKICKEDSEVVEIVSNYFAVWNTNTYMRKNWQGLVLELCDLQNKRLKVSVLKTIQHIVALFRKSSEFYWQMKRQAIHYYICNRRFRHGVAEIYCVRICKYISLHENLDIETRRKILNSLLLDYPFMTRIYNQLLHGKF